MNLIWQELPGRDRIEMATGCAGTWVVVDRGGLNELGCKLYLMYPGEPYWPISPVHTKTVTPMAYAQVARESAQFREDVEDGFQQSTRRAHRSLLDGLQEQTR
ncbi:hypothetical protein GBP61_23840 [Mycobacterium avium subsp. hominissuis]|nr:hypothetical protein [Mycobacterium avium subsp. hominissuis]